ncbi:MAG: histidinol-phosphate aminotransferase [Thermacetogenium sp.]|uniref:Histidinol-phosphate aminotransferase n=1 Tax=Thermacetogenium phaeum TaxID=85874 RepID=A0A124FKH7_9THEO|nr:MAG: Histidinol-phosphate aminotransferase [Thermacetogenium phaeum]MDN5365375.1 histidinol-phosphate aminotransferase [Thermacetogenium sp.]
MDDVNRLGRRAIFDLKPYVPGKPIEEVEREYGITGVIKLASNENPLGPSPAALNALKEAINKVHNYPDGNCYYLKKELANSLHLPEDHFIIGNGTDEILKMLGETFLNPGERVLFAWPSFSEYDFITRLMGARPVTVPLRNFVHDLDEIARQVDEETKLIFICNPNNPTGTIVGGQDLRLFLNKIPSSVLVVVDEAYYEYVTAPQYTSAVELVKEDKRVIVLRTFSKIYGLAGLRVGYGIAAPEIIQLINRVREPFNVNLLAQKAAVAALQDKDFLEQSRNVVLKGKEYLYDSFVRLKLEYIPSEANFIFVNLKRDSREVFMSLLKEGIIVRTGDIFGYPTWIRVTVGTPEQNERFIAALEKILDDRV